MQSFPLNILQDFAPFIWRYEKESGLVATKTTMFLWNAVDLTFGKAVVLPATFAILQFSWPLVAFMHFQGEKIKQYVQMHQFLQPRQD